MSNTIICVSIIVTITLIVLYMYYIQETKHQYQLAKIASLENKYRDKEKKMKEIANTMKECPIKNLKTPRKCYFGSNYKCSWNDSIKRCDAI